MAKLISDNFKLDIQFINYSEGAINYRIQLQYGKNVVFNPLITDKKYFTVQEFKNDYLLAIIKEALEITMEDAMEYLQEEMEYLSVFWVPNSTMALTISPRFHLGFKDSRCPEKETVVEQQKLMAIDEFRETGAQFPGDMFILSFCIQVKGLRHLKSAPIKWRGNALSMTMRVKRPALEKFLSELQAEYENFCKKFKVNELGDKVQEFFDGSAKPEEMSDLEKQFDQEMRKIYWKAKELGMDGDTFIGLIEEHEGCNAAKLLLRGRDSTTGADKLRFFQIIKGAGLELTAEYLVAQLKWSRLFTKEEIKEAKRRLDQWK